MYFTAWGRRTGKGHLLAMKGEAGHFVTTSTSFAWEEENQAGRPQAVRQDGVPVI